MGHQHHQRMIIDESLQCHVPQAQAVASQDGSISERLSDELQPLLEAEKEKAKDRNSAGQISARKMGTYSTNFNKSAVLPSFQISFSVCRPSYFRRLQRSCASRTCFKAARDSFSCVTCRIHICMFPYICIYTVSSHMRNT